MLIALNDVEDARAVAEEIKSEITTGLTSIYTPPDLGSYIQAVKEYDPRESNNLILLRSHYSEVDHWSIDLGRWRMHDLYFAQKGGAVWGKDQSRYESATYEGELEDISRIITTGEWNHDRSRFISTISKPLMGRTALDPHTILVGYAINYPADSKPFRYIISSLPEEWWKGVAFLRASSVSVKMLEWFEYSNFVTLGENSHSVLTARDVEHGALPLVPTSAYALKVIPEPKFGTMIRELSKTKEKALDWTYPSRV